MALLLGVAALLSVAWSFTTAPLQGPDESAHFSYIQHLAETGHKPRVLGGIRPDSTEVGTALAFFNLAQLRTDPGARPAWSQLEERRFKDTLEFFGEKAQDDGSGPNPLAKNPPLYYAYQVVPYYVGSAGSFWDRLIVMRLASGLLFLLAVTSTWLAASELFAATWPRVLATGSVALLPGLTSISGSVNADNMLIAAWSGFIFAALRLVRRGPTVGRVLAVCALGAASLLTHGRGTAIVVPLVVVLAVALLRARPPLVAALRTLVPGLGLLVGAFVAYRLLLAPSGGSYGGEVNLGAAGFNLRHLISSTWQFYFPALPFMNERGGPDYGYRQVFIETFFGSFASLDVDYPTAVYTLIQVVCALGLIGLVAALVRRLHTLRARWPQVVVLVAVTASMLALLHTVSYRALLSGADPLITGRYLLPLVTILGLTVAFVLTSVRPHVSAVLGALVLSGLVALNLVGLMLTLTRFYG
ncbi:MAG TPA: DUF2142 domain-containing protein [Solirubrobacteraceae bacterium]|nr:DUF2142 domain-containing protein [Solirubrobacteraceae bacterium]